MIITITVITFSLVQSLFGMGLLVFGTPTMLLFGFSFPETLATLLPASVTISLLQILEGQDIDRSFKRSFFTWCIPSLALTLTAYLIWGSEIRLEFFLGLLMLIFALVRLAPTLTKRAGEFVKANIPLWMIGMGIIHGLSNMGGSVLSVVAGTYFTDKLQIRYAISFCYLCFGIVQISLLVFLQSDTIGVQQLLMAPLAALIYLIVGRKSFYSVSDALFQNMFTIFILLYSFLLITKSLGGL